MIPLSGPDITKKEIHAVVEVLKSSRLALGSKLSEFEKKIKKYTGVKYAVALNSGTAALHLIIRALGIGPGDEVITTPFSFISSSNCILYEGATPVFTDICPKTFNIDAGRIESKITKKTKAILAVDVFGYPADWDALGEIARKHNLKLIEDSAEALGSTYYEKKCGTFGDAAIFSFYPNKQITTGEGGVMVTRNKRVADLCRSMSNQGRKTKGSRWLEHVRLGYNYRMSDLHAALGMAQLARIDEILKQRQRIAEAYHALLKNVTSVKIPFSSPETRRSWFVYVVTLAQCYSRARRDQIIKSMEKSGIQCSAYFRPIHLQKHFRDAFGYRRGDFPVCESVADRTIALPFFNHLKQAEIKRTVRILSGLL